MIPLLTYLNLYSKIEDIRSVKQPQNAAIVTPTTELAFQVASVIRNVIASSGQVRGLDIKVCVVSPPQNLHLLSVSAPSLTSPPMATTNNDRTSTIFVGSAKSLHSSLTRGKSGYDGGGISPTPPPLVERFYGRVGFLVLDEVDRLLLEKRRNGRGKLTSLKGSKFKDNNKNEDSKRHEKPSAIIAASVARARKGRVVVIGASATVGRR